MTGADNPHFTGQWMGAAQTVDLTTIRRAHDGEQYPVASLNVGGQIIPVEKRSAGRTATHEKAGNRSLGHRCTRNHRFLLARTLQHVRAAVL
jgi:hypothetical protein